MKKFVVVTALIFASGLAHASDLPSKKNVSASATSKAKPAMVYSGDFSVGLSYDSWKAAEANLGPSGDSAYYGVINGRALLPLTDNFGVQFDGEYKRDTSNSESVETYTSAGHFGGHALYRTNDFQFGVFGGIGSTVNYSNEDWRSSIYGVEGQFYLKDLTFWAQAGQAFSQEFDAPEKYNPVQVRAGLRYFLDANTRIDLEGGYASGTIHGITFFPDSNNATQYTWTVGAERLFEIHKQNVGVFANYTGTHIVNDHSTPFLVTGGEGQVFTVGISLKFGTGSLLEQDRHGTNTDMKFSTLANVDNLYGADSYP